MISALLLLLLVVAAFVVWRRFRRTPLFKLTLRESDGAGMDFVVYDSVATIGSQEGDTVVVSHPRVSRQHAVLEERDGKFVIMDRSRYGIRVNGEPAREAELQSGDLIRLGDSIDLIFTRL